MTILPRLDIVNRVDDLAARVVGEQRVFQNRLLLEQVTARLESQGFTVLTHHLVPANDGGLSLGQAAIAAARLTSH